jgi:hypothetical protein
MMARKHMIKLQPVTLSLFLLLPLYYQLAFNDLFNLILRK